MYQVASLHRQLVLISVYSRSFIFYAAQNFPLQSRPRIDYTFSSGQQSVGLATVILAGLTLLLNMDNLMLRMIYLIYY